MIQQIPLTILLLSSLVVSYVNAQWGCVAPVLDPSALVPPSANQCKWQNFDFSPLAQQDIYLEYSDYYASKFFALRLCGTVTDPTCTQSLSNSSLCQWGSNVTQGCSPSISQLNNSASYVYSYINDDPEVGVQISTQGNSVYCPNSGQPAIYNIQLQCDRNAPEVPFPSYTTSVTLMDYYWSCICNVTIVIPTSLSCPTYSSSSSSSSSTGGSSSSGMESSVSFSSSSSSTGLGDPSFPVDTAYDPRIDCIAQPFGFNLTALNLDLTYYDKLNNYQYIMNPCAPISDPFCQKLATSPTLSSCQYTPCNPGLGNRLNYFDPSQHQYWTLTNGQNLSAGIQLVTANGGICQANPARQVTQLVCNQTATTPFISSVSQPDICTFLMVIQTSIACDFILPPASNYNCTSGCCALGYDLSGLSYDIYGYDTDWGTFALHLCGSTTTTSCYTGTQMCKNPGCWGSALSKYRYTYEQYVNNRDYTDGIMLEWSNGDYCYNDYQTPSGNWVYIYGPARHRIILLCDPNATHPTHFDRMVQDPVCVYTTYIKTSIVCGAPSLDSSQSFPMLPYQEIPQCNFFGYDFSPLSGYDIYSVFNSFIFVSRICGQVQDAACLRNDFTRNSTVCQMYACTNISPYNEYLISTWNPAIAESKFINDIDWTGGVQVSVQDGQNCDNGPRTVRWNFICDPNAVYAFSNLTVEESGRDYCHYDITIRTTIVCSPPDGPIIIPLIAPKHEESDSKVSVHHRVLHGDATARSFSLALLFALSAIQLALFLC